MATKKTATKKTATKKTAKKKATAKTAPPETADIDVAPTYVPWVPATMPVGGKSNSTEQLNDHPTEHNHTAAAVSDIVDRFADLRLYVPGVNSCGIAGDLTVDGNTFAKINVPADAWGVANGTVFADQGMVGGTQGSFGTAMTANGYRNDSGGWTSLRLNGSNGATVMELLPIGKFHVRTATTQNTASQSPPLQFEVNESFTKAYGDLTVGKVVKASNGTKTAAAYSFNNDTKTGMYLYSSGVLALTANGKDVARFGDAGVTFPGHKTTTIAPNAYIATDGQLMRSTAARVDTADIERLETLVEKLSARIEQLEERLKPGTADA